MTKIYLAGPLFTLAEQGFNAGLARFLESEGYEVWLPQEHEPRSQTARSIFDMDVGGIDWADMVVACMDGPDPDSGTAWECGYAYAKGKPIVCYRTDFRVSGDTTSAPYNLMLDRKRDDALRNAVSNQDSGIPSARPRAHQESFAAAAGRAPPWIASVAAMSYDGSAPAAAT